MNQAETQFENRQIKSVSFAIVRFVTVVKQTPSAEGPGYGTNHFFGSNYGRRLGEW
jgi:hypothetical protein